jgi:hypothetical protein
MALKLGAMRPPAGTLALAVRRRLVALAGAAMLAACTPDNGPLMRPGDDCLRCHGGATPGTSLGLETRHAGAWSLAGTVYATLDAPTDAGVEGARIQVTDAKGFNFELQSNLAGNFYSAESVTFPLHVCVERHGQLNCMDTPSPHGACNYCHTVPGREQADGRIAAP